LTGDALQRTEVANRRCSGQVDDVIRSGTGGEAQDAIRPAAVRKDKQIVAPSANQQVVVNGGVKLVHLMCCGIRRCGLSR